jgi:serine/threonine protein kinase
LKYLLKAAEAPENVELTREEIKHVTEKLASSDGDLLGSIDDLFDEKIEELSPPLPDQESNPIAETFKSLPMANWEFAAKYRVISDKELGAGGVGIVYRAVKRDDPNGEVFAAKMFRRGFNNSANPEIESGKYLDHPRVTRVYETFVGDDSSSTVIVMRLMKGQDMKHKISTMVKDLNGKMFPKEILFDWLIQCSELMVYINSKKIIHRDPHAGNWMIDDEGKIYLTDFGTGKYLENDMVTDNHTGHSSWCYGPEAFTGEDYSYKADIPSYGKGFAQIVSWS